MALCEGRAPHGCKLGPGLPGRSPGKPAAQGRSRVSAAQAGLRALRRAAALQTLREEGGCSFSFAAFAGYWVKPMTEVPLIVSDFEFIRRIGRGSYGEVWLARSVT